jgi:hypothetical protein
MKSGIYKIVINGKVYVGRDKNIYKDKRKKSHLSKLKKGTHPNAYLQAAYIKYKEFNYEVIEMCDAEMLNEREVYWVDKLNSIYSKGGYNLTNGGDGSPSELLNDTELKKRNSKISDTLKKHFKENINPFKGKCHTIDCRKIMSEKRMGMYVGIDNPRYKEDITNDMIRNALITEGSIKAAARLLNCSASFVGYRIKSTNMNIVYKDGRTTGRGVKIEKIL